MKHKWSVSKKMLEFFSTVLPAVPTCLTTYLLAMLTYLLTYLHGIYYYLQAVQSAATIQKQLECGPMPNVMSALPNIGGALCSMPQSFADAQY